MGPHWDRSLPCDAWIPQEIWIEKSDLEQDAK